jgi:hypothetical protein
MTMNERDDLSTRELERRAQALPLEIAPERDLWRGIELRLGARDVAAAPPRRAAGWPWLSMTAALAAGYALATFVPLQPVGSDSVSPVSPIASTLIDNIAPALAQLPAKTRAAVEADLTGLERDRQQIEEALAQEPDNPLLLELQMSTVDRAEALRAQMNRLMDAAGDEGIEI